MNKKFHYISPELRIKFKAGPDDPVNWDTYILQKKKFFGWDDITYVYHSQFKSVGEVTDQLMYQMKERERDKERARQRKLESKERKKKAISSRDPFYQKANNV